jgi:hypothetical protein
MKKELPEEILEFEERGFARTSEKLLKYIRSRDKLIKIFIPAKTKGTNRSHGPIKIIGDYYRYYYKIDHKKDFVEFLVDKFYKNNPDPSPGKKMAFTHILHNNGLHWEGCEHKKG